MVSPSKKRIAVILARGGSKRVPGKNLRPLCGRPLVSWPINAALDSGAYHEVLVSTDDPAIARIASDLGVRVLLRSPELASDLANVTDVVRDVVVQEQVADSAFVTALLGTAAFVPPSTLRAATEFLQSSANVDSILAVQEYRHPPQRALRIGEDHYLAPVRPECMSYRTQDLETRYFDSGQFYIMPAKCWLDRISPFAGKVHPIVLAHWEAIDIDTEADFRLAELVKRWSLERLENEQQ